MHDMTSLGEHDLLRLLPHKRAECARETWVCSRFDPGHHMKAFKFKGRCEA